MLKKYSGIIFLLIAVLCWGPAPVFTKLSLSEIPEFSFAFMGRIIALSILAPIFIPRGNLKIDRRDLPTFILAGLTGSVFNVGFFLFGIKMTNAMDAQAIFSSGPILTTVFAYFILHERIRRIQIFGVVLGFLGAVLIAGRSYFDTGGFLSGNLLGNALIAVSATSWVMYILISKKLSEKYTPATITLYSFIVSALAFLPIFFISNPDGFEWMRQVSLLSWWGVFYIGIFASVIAFFTYQTGLRLTSAFTGGVVMYVQPIITTIAAYFLLGEKITLPFVIGAVLIILGSVIATQHEYVRRNVKLAFIWKQGAPE